MARGTTYYDTAIRITEDELLFLIKTADALDEIGATEQANAIRDLTNSFVRIPRHETVKV